MRHRIFGFVGVIVVVGISLALASLAGQAPATSARPEALTEPGGVLKTAWGEPNLQGIWTDEHQTPVQRNRKYGAREFLTQEELASIDQKRQKAIGRDFRPPTGSEADVAGAYNFAFETPLRTGRRTSLVVDPPDGRIPPLTAEANKKVAVRREFTLATLQATAACKNVEQLKATYGVAACAGGKYAPTAPRRAEVFPFYNTDFSNRADGPEDRSLGERCMGAQLPDFSGHRRIVQSPGTVSIFYDVGQGQGWERVIPITNAPHLPPNMREWFGDSRGRWEGNTLVVDVTNFTAKTSFSESRENLHLIERWTGTSQNTVEYAVTIEDPTTWTRPWTVKQDLTRQDDEANRIYYAPRCHEGNFGMVGMLSGARDAEKAFADGRGPDPASIDLYSVSTFFRRSDDDVFTFRADE